MFKFDNVLVLGARGMVGSSIVRQLKREKYENILTPARTELDLMCPFTINEYFNKHRIDYVFFAAARVGGIRANIDFPATFGHENMSMILNVFEAAAVHNVAKLLFLGSSCIYPRDCPQPMKEEHLLTGKFEPTNEMYAFSKAFGIKLCQAYNKQYKTNFISCQPPNIYGENDSFHPEHSHVMAAMIRKFEDAKVKGLSTVTCWGSGNARRELMYVDDLAEVCLFLMNNYAEDDFINVGTNEDHSIKEIAEAVAGIVGYTGQILWDTSKPEGMPRKLMDSTNINQRGWKSKTTLLDGIKKTYNWWLANSKV